MNDSWSLWLFNAGFFFTQFLFYLHIIQPTNKFLRCQLYLIYCLNTMYSILSTKSICLLMRCYWDKLFTQWWLSGHLLLHIYQFRCVSLIPWQRKNRSLFTECELHRNNEFIMRGGETCLNGAQWRNRFLLFRMLH